MEITRKKNFQLTRSFTKCLKGASTTLEPVALSILVHSHHSHTAIILLSAASSSAYLHFYSRQ